MPGLVPGIHVFPSMPKEVVDGRERRQVYVVCAKQTTTPGHDDDGPSYRPVFHALVNSAISALTASRIADGVREKRGAGAG